jgi:hypothetical protein
MDAAQIARTLTFVPSREPRLQTGALFALDGAECRHAEKLAHLAPLLHWLTPLYSITLEDQQALGLVGPNGRALHAGDEDADLPLDEADEEVAAVEQELV